jgi:hypothetical protein
MLGMRLVIVSVVSLLGLSSFGVKTIAQTGNPFDSVEAWNQRDYSLILRKLFVIGDSQGSSGLLGLQKTLIEDLKLSAELEIDLKEAIQRASNLSAARTLIADRTFEFRRSIIPRIPAIYKADWEQQPEGFGTFDRIMTEKVLELKQKEFALSRPVISQLEPLGGLRGFYVQQLFESRQLNPSSDLLEELKAGRLLSFEHFRDLLTLLNPQIDLSESSKVYQQFAIYRLFARIDEIPARDFEAFDAEMNLIAEELINEAHRLELKAPQFQLNKTSLRFFWLLRAWIEARPLSIDWDHHAEDKNLLSGWNYLVSTYATRWTELNQIPEEIQFDEPARKLIADAIDEMVLSLFKIEESSDFESAIQQFQEGLWLDLSPEDSALRKLPEELRQILAARLFPDLSLKQGRALLEGRLFESLDELDRRELLSSIYGAEIPTDEFEKQRTLSPSDPDAIHRYHYDLVKAYLIAQSLIEETADTMTLSSGDEIPTVESERRKMRLLLAQNRDSFDYGAFPPTLIDELAVLLFPSPEHLSDLEPKRFWNEWERQTLLRELMISQQGFLAEIQRAPTMEEKQKIEAQFIKTLEDFQEKLSSYKIDMDSEATWLAAFLYGALPHSNEASEIFKTIGIGATFALSVKIFGVRAVSWFIVLDTGTRLVTSGYLDEDFDDLDLNRGFSTPIGKWTAQSLQGGLHLLSKLQTAKTAGESMELAYDLGTLSSDLVWFGVGASAVRWSVDLSSYRRWRRAKTIHSELERFQKQAQQTQLKVDQLKARLGDSLSTWESLQLSGRALTKEGELLSKNIDDLRLQIFDLEQVRLTKVQGRVGFYSRALISTVVEIAKSIVPSKRPLKERLAKIQRSWSRRTNLAIEQYAREMQRLEAELLKIEQAEWAWQHRPSLRARAHVFQRELKNFQRLQEQMNLQMLEAQTLLDSAAQVSLAKAQKIYDSARRALEKARTSHAQSRRAFESAWEQASIEAARTQPLNQGLKALDGALTGSTNPLPHLSQFPRRMKATLQVQSRLIESLLTEIP